LSLYSSNVTSSGCEWWGRQSAHLTKHILNNRLWSTAKWWYHNLWPACITKNQTLLINSSLPKKVTEDTDRIFGMTYTMKNGDTCWKWGVFMWTGSASSRQGPIRGNTPLLEKLTCSAVPEIPHILSNPAVHYHVQRNLPLSIFSAKSHTSIHLFRIH
jgi:hypothetical protein